MAPVRNTIKQLTLSQRADPGRELREMMRSIWSNRVIMSDGGQESTHAKNKTNGAAHLSSPRVENINVTGQKHETFIFKAATRKYVQKSPATLLMILNF